MINKLFKHKISPSNGKLVELCSSLENYIKVLQETIQFFEDNYEKQIKSLSFHLEEDTCCSFDPEIYLKYEKLKNKCEFIREHLTKIVT